MKVKIKLGDLVEAVAAYAGNQLLYEKEIVTRNFGLTVPSSSGNFVPIDAVIKKRALGRELKFEGGHNLRCADGHILYVDRRKALADSLVPGDRVDTAQGHLVVEKVQALEEQDFYDIAVPHPHLYVDAAGIVHHNTLLTSALSLLTEPYGRSVVIVPSKNLVVQTEEDYRNLGLDVGVYYGERKEPGHQHTICTWQTLANVEKTGGMADFAKDVVCFMVDECFDGATPVLTPAGWRSIRDLKAGDEVINMNAQGGFKSDTVVKVYENLTTALTEKMFRLEMDDGTVIEVTGNHRFMTQRGWVRVDELTPEDEITSHHHG